jgi:hypothetical protein
MPSISSEMWRPVPDMPASFSSATYGRTEKGLVVELQADGDDRTLVVVFRDAVAFAVYDELVFSISDIESGDVRSSACIVHGSDWPVSHERINTATPRSVTHYRIFTFDSVLDVLASGSVDVTWRQATGR